MKSFLKNVMLAITLFAAITSASAGNLCRAHNERGQYFYIVSGSKFTGTASVIALCAENSNDCTFDECRKGSEADIPRQPVLQPAPRPARWQCNATNARRQVWTGTGESRAVAASNATGFCVAHSRVANNCKIQNCFMK